MSRLKPDGGARRSISQPPPVYRTMESWHWIDTPGGRIRLRWNHQRQVWGDEHEGEIGPEQFERLAWTWAGLAEPP